MFSIQITFQDYSYYFKNLKIGPLVQHDRFTNKATLIGVVSFGYACGRINYPAIYTRVSNYVPWINQVMEQY